MIGNQPPLADVLADLGQWLQQWATFIQSQIETKQIHLSEEDGLSPAVLDESDVMTAGQTAVPREGLSPPAHWLALFAERGDRSLEEAATANAEMVAVPVEFEAGLVDTAVLTAWIVQMHDGLLAFRKQVDSEFSAEQAEDMLEASHRDMVPFVPSIDKDENGEDNDEVPLVAASIEQKTPPKQAIPQPYPDEQAEIERERPLLPSPPAPTIFSPTMPGPFTGGARSEIPLADAQTIQRKVNPTGEPTAIQEHFPTATAPSSSPVPPDEEDGRAPVPDLSSPPHPRQTRSVPAVSKTRAEWPELPPAPMNAPDQAAVPLQPPHTAKRVTRLRLNPLPQRESFPAQRTPVVTTPPSDSDPIGSVALEHGDPLARVTQQPAVEGLVAAPAEKAPPMAVESHLETAVPPTAVKPMGKVQPLAAESRLETAVPLFSVSESAPQPPLPTEKPGRKGKARRVVNRNLINLPQSPIVQAVAAPPQEQPMPDRSQVQASLPPLVESGQARDSGEAERPLPPEPTKQAADPFPAAESPSEPAVWPDKTRSSLEPEPAAVVEEKRPLKLPDYQIPPPAGLHQPPQWSVTPENRWPSLPPLPPLAPNPASVWRHQPARRQRLDREQQGTSWNESFS